MLLVKFKNSSFMLSICSVIAICFSVNVQAVPPGATPGGVVPKLDKQLLEPFVYPSVIQERKLEVDPKDDPTAPRMIVKDFKVEGVVDRPEHQISKKFIEYLANDEAFRIASDKPPYGFTVSMFEQVAGAITRYYRAKGYFLARAYIPEQVVKDGVVVIRVVESLLGSVVVDGNSLFETKQLTDPFKNLVGKAIFKDDIESELYKLNDYHGLTARGVFGPGAEPGTSAMLIKVKEKPTEGFVSFDNYGSIFTGEYRLRLHYEMNNVFKTAGQLKYDLLSTLNTGSVFGQVQYSQPIFDRTYRTGGGISFNTFEVGNELEDLSLTGNSLMMNGFLSKQIYRSKSDRLIAGSALHLKQAESSTAGNVQADDTLTVVQLTGYYDGINRLWSNSKHAVNLDISIGLADLLGSLPSDGGDLSSRSSGSETKAGGDFTKTVLSYQNFYKINQLQSLIFRFKTQMTSDLLTSLEQMPLGGPDTVRAYPVSEALVDKGTFFSFEWIVANSPDVEYDWLNKLRMSAFYDYASGEIIDPLVSETPKVSLGAIGIAAQVEPFKKFKVRVDLALTEIGDKPSDNQSLPFYIRLEYGF